MDRYCSNTNEAIRKPRTHLTLDERGMIQALNRQGCFSLCRTLLWLLAVRTQPFTMN